MKHEHCCPACGVIHECARDIIPFDQNKNFGTACVDYWPLPCSETCARQMAAVEAWLRKRGIG